jgi:hypothetical protein
VQAKRQFPGGGCIGVWRGSVVGPYRGRDEECHPNGDGKKRTYLKNAWT